MRFGLLRARLHLCDACPQRCGSALGVADLGVAAFGERRELRLGRARLRLGLFPCGLELREACRKLLGLPRAGAGHLQLVVERARPLLRSDRPIAGGHDLVLELVTLLAGAHELIGQRPDAVLGVGEFAGRLARRLTGLFGRGALRRERALQIASVFEGLLGLCASALGRGGGRLQLGLARLELGAQLLHTPQEQRLLVGQAVGLGRPRLESGDRLARPLRVEFGPLRSHLGRGGAILGLLGLLLELPGALTRFGGALLERRQAAARLGFAGLQGRCPLALLGGLLSQLGLCRVRGLQVPGQRGRLALQVGGASLGLLSTLTELGGDRAGRLDLDAELLVARLRFLRAAGDELRGPLGFRLQASGTVALLGQRPAHRAERLLEPLGVLLPLAGLLGEHGESLFGRAGARRGLLELAGELGSACRDRLAVGEVGFELADALRRALRLLLSLPVALLLGRARPSYLVVRLLELLGAGDDRGLEVGDPLLALATVGECDGERLLELACSVRHGGQLRADLLRTVVGLLPRGAHGIEIGGALAGVRELDAELGDLRTRLMGGGLRLAAGARLLLETVPDLREFGRGTLSRHPRRALLFESGLELRGPLGLTERGAQLFFERGDLLLGLLGTTRRLLGPLLRRPCRGLQLVDAPLGPVGPGVSGLPRLVRGGQARLGQALCLRALPQRHRESLALGLRGLFGFGGGFGGRAQLLRLGLRLLGSGLRLCDISLRLLLRGGDLLLRLEARRIGSLLGPGALRLRLGKGATCRLLGLLDTGSRLLANASLLRLRFRCLRTRLFGGGERSPGLLRALLGVLRGDVAGVLCRRADVLGGGALTLEGLARRVPLALQVLASGRERGQRLGGLALTRHKLGRQTIALLERRPAVVAELVGSGARFGTHLLQLGLAPLGQRLRPGQLVASRVELTFGPLALCRARGLDLGRRAGDQGADLGLAGVAHARDLDVEVVPSRLGLSRHACSGLLEALSRIVLLLGRALGLGARHPLVLELLLYVAQRLSAGLGGAFGVLAPLALLAKFDTERSVVGDPDRRRLARTTRVRPREVDHDPATSVERKGQLSSVQQRGRGGVGRPPVRRVRSGAGGRVVRARERCEAVAAPTVIDHQDGCGQSLAPFGAPATSDPQQHRAGTGCDAFEGLSLEIGMTRAHGTAPG